MKIKTSELYLGYSGIKQEKEQSQRSEVTRNDRGRGRRGDQVSISALGQSMTSSKKLNAVFSQSLIREKNGSESRLNHGSLNFSRQDSNRNSSWQLGISNIRNSGGTRISLASRTHSEKEKMAFASTGNISMADGRQVEFSLQMLMQREFEIQETDALSASTVQMMDPLVINFSGTAPTLTDTKYQFDLDADGFYENISFVGQGSGFLTLDLNEDGIVNDGSELFGPNLGNGFNELNAYDLDGNQWIDENDAVFEKLKVWTKDGSGQDQLRSLKELGIGAISLENVATPFSITNHQNEIQGQVRNSSIILKEDGNIHTVQQIDLMAEKTMDTIVPSEPISIEEVFVAKQILTLQNVVDKLHENVTRIYQQQEERHNEFLEKFKRDILQRDEIVINQMYSGLAKNRVV